MGKIIDFGDYREKHKPKRSDGVYMETVPPYIIFKYYENGIIRKEYRLISERMIRDLLDDM